MESLSVSHNLTTSERRIAYWLMCVAVMVFVMAIIGAVTRLTGSGLSMVEWRPLINTLPPLSEAEWLRVFGAYKQSPEYLHINSWMQLADFKLIFFWEWLHRLWGRLIGLAFFVPAFWFLITRQINRSLLPGIGGIFFLGMLQAGVGWWMVKSGLADEPVVSHYRLSIHLGIALCILVAMWVQALALFVPPQPITPRIRTIRSYGFVLLTLLVLTILWGAFTAGKDAGLVYNTWPKMGEVWFPRDAVLPGPLWLSFFESHGIIQFTHRVFATLVCVLTLIYGLLTYRALRTEQVLFFSAQGFVISLPIIAVLQFIIGVMTVISGVPVSLGVLHQVGAMLFLLCLTGLLTVLRPTKTNQQVAF